MYKTKEELKGERDKPILEESVCHIKEMILANGKIA